MWEIQNITRLILWILYFVKRNNECDIVLYVHIHCISYFSGIISHDLLLKSYEKMVKHGHTPSCWDSWKHWEIKCDKLEKWSKHWTLQFSEFRTNNIEEKWKLEKIFLWCFHTICLTIMTAIKASSGWEEMAVMTDKAPSWKRLLIDQVNSLFYGLRCNVPMGTCYQRTHSSEQ